MENTNFFVWALQTITATGKGIVILHNYIFFTFLSAVLTFVLLAIFLVIVDAHVTSQSVLLQQKSLNVYYIFLNYLKKLPFKIIQKNVYNLQEKASLLLKVSAKHLTSPTKNTIHRFELASGNKVVHGTLLEVVWTLLPSIILMLIAVPSFALLYSMDEVVLPDYVIRAIGHQWYWSYENVGKLHKNFSSGFDSYMVSDRDLVNKDFRLLEADTSLLVPVNTHLRFLFTSSDVLHSWTVPSLGIKVDAVPGRLSQFNTFVEYDNKNLASHEVGLQLYGQCSELCGVNHGFMPISVTLV